MKKLCLVWPKLCSSVVANHQPSILIGKDHVLKCDRQCNKQHLFILLTDFGFANNSCHVGNTKFQEVFELKTLVCSSWNVFQGNVIQCCMVLQCANTALVFLIVSLSWVHINHACLELSSLWRTLAEFKVISYTSSSKKYQTQTVQLMQMGILKKGLTLLFVLFCSV